MQTSSSRVILLICIYMINLKSNVIAIMGMKAAAVTGAPLQASSSRAVPLLQRSVLQMQVVFLEPNISESVQPSSAADREPDRVVTEPAKLQTEEVLQASKPGTSATALLPAPPTPMRHVMHNPVEIRPRRTALISKHFMLRAVQTLLIL